MNTSKIQSIENLHKSWQSRNGTLHNFRVTMEDGTVLEVNSTSDKGPPYDVGDDVEYTVTRENEYGKSGKVKRAEGSGPSKSQKAFHGGMKAKFGEDRSVGMRVGMAINNACQFLIHAEGGAHYDIGSIKKHALEIYEAAESMEKYVQDKGSSEE